MFGFSSRKGNYAYTTTRAKAKKSLLLKEEDYNKMLQMSTVEIARFISDSGYSKEMIDLANKMEGMDLVERATYRHMAESFKTLLDGSQGDLHTLLAAYLEKWDNWNIKVILRGKSYGVSVDDIRDDLVPAGNLSTEELERLIGMESIEEILAAYCKAESISIPQEILSRYKTDGNLGQIEDYLDKFRYIRLVKAINADSVASRMFLDYVRKEIDVRNFETIMKLKVAGVHGDKVLEYMIPGGKQIDTKFAKQLADYEKVSDTYSDISQLDFYEAFKEFIDKGLTPLDASIETKKFHREQAKKFSSEYPLSVLPVIDYMISMEIETDNIRTIARGLESGLDKETVRQLLVI